MKKKLFAILLAVVMVLGLVTPALADTKTTTTETTQVMDDGTVVTTTVTVTVTTPDKDGDKAVSEAPAEPVNPEPTETEPAETEPTETEPAETELADTETEPIEAEPEPVKETDEDLLAAAEAANGKVVILYTNDVHCGVADNIGYVGLAKLKKALENAGNDVLLVDNGDAVQGDTIGTLSKGTYIIDIMNAIGYDVATIGNHEFDYGMEQFMENAARASFPYVSANFTDADGNLIFDAYTILEAGGKKIAFVGLTTPRTFVSSTPSYFQNEAGEYIYTFSEDESGEKLYTATQNAVDAARNEGADYVIALTHLGIEEDCRPWTSSEVINNTTGIDVFLDAHSHSVLPCEIVKNKDGKDVILTSTGTKLAYVGVLTIDEDGTLRTMLLDETTLAYADLIGAIEDDGGIGAIIDEINAEFAALINAVVAHSDVDLVTQDPENADVRIIRNQETNLGDLCADAYRSVSGAQIAFVNGGGIRKAIPAGDITYGQIISVHPFGNMMCVAEVSGSTILDALELSAASLPGEFGGFQHVSGMRFTIDLNVDSTVETNDKGEFIGVNGDRRIKDVTVLNAETGEYEPLDPEKTYTLASHNYLLEGAGDGFKMFKGCTLLQDKVMIDNQVLITYIVDKLGGVVGSQYADPFGEGRITIIQKGAQLSAEDAEPATEEVTEPATEETEAPATEEIEEPATEEATEPATEETEAPATEEVEQPTTEEVTEPATEETEAPATEEIEEPATEEVTEPATEETEAPATEKPLERVYGRWHCDLCGANFYSSPEIENNQYVCRICGKTGGLYQIDGKGNPINPVTEEPAPAETVTEPEAEQATEPAAEEVTEPEAEQATEPEAEQASEPEAEQATQPGGEQATEPEAEQATEPEAEQVTEPEAEQATEPEPLLGGWTVHSDATVYTLPEGAQAAFTKAIGAQDAIDAKPIALIGQQVVSGTNYAILAEVKPLIEGGDIVPTLQVLVVYADLQGNASLLETLPFDLGALAENSDAALPLETLAGGWAAPAEYTAVTLPEDVQAVFDMALDGYIGLQQTPIAYLGRQLAAGSNYAILTHASLLTATPIHAVQILFLHVDLDGNASIMSISTVSVPALMELAAAAEAPAVTE